MKHKNKEKDKESLYSKAVRDNSVTHDFSELSEFIKVDILKKKSKNLQFEMPYIDKNHLPEMKEKIIEANIPNLSYLPKRNVKFTPSNLMSYPHPKHFARRSLERKEEPADNLQINAINSARNNDDLDYLTFKTNFILKLARNVENYDKLYNFIDIISENNKKIVLEYYNKLKILTEKKDRALFDNFNVNSTNVSSWKDLTLIFYEFELTWQKFTEVILRELKHNKDVNVHLSKKGSDQVNLLKLKDNEITYLNDFIKKNDLHHKSNLKNGKMKDTNEMKTDYERKEKLNLLNTIRLEDE